MYVHVCQGKTNVYVLKHCQVKDKAKKLILKNENRLSSNQTTRKIKLTERKQRRKKIQTTKIIFFPQYGRQFCYEEKHYMAWGKPQQTEMNAEINSNLKYAI
jgi:hypothetical protein